MTESRLDPKRSTPPSSGQRDAPERDTAPGGPGGGDEDPMERADRANGEPAATDE